jgi:hypothetical protein
MLSKFGNHPQVWDAELHAGNHPCIKLSILTKHSSIRGDCVMQLLPSYDQVFSNWMTKLHSECAHFLLVFEEQGQLRCLVSCNINSHSSLKSKKITFLLPKSFIEVWSALIALSFYAWQTCLYYKSYVEIVNCKVVIGCPD